jgi:hypothetical protein
VTLALAVLILLGPPVSLTGVWISARRLKRRPGLPWFVASVAHLFVILGALSMLFGVAGGVHAGRAIAGSVAPEQKARHLAEGISEAMSCSALGILSALVGALWLAACAWRWRKPAGRTDA